MKRLGFALLAALLVLIHIPQPVYADANIIVNTTADEDNSGPSCSLREAIIAANTDANYGGCIGGNGNDTITFDLNVFSTTQTITLTSNLPDITTNMSIVGPGTDLLTVSGATSYKPFHITNTPTVSLSDLTVTQGYAVAGGNLDVENGLVTLTRLIVTHGQAWLFYGGGISNSGTLTVQDSTISDNSAAQDGGGLSNIDNGTVIVRNTTFSNNVAGNRGGGVFNYNYHVSIQGSTFNNNTAQDGGGLASYDLVVVTNTTFSGNSATNRGGGIASLGYRVKLISSTLSGNSAPTGGGLYGNSNLDVYNSIIANSSSGGDCSNASTGDIYNSLVGDGGCGITNGVNGNLIGNPLLQALADNGGPTQTMALSASSPAINAGNNSYLSEANFIDFNEDNDYIDSLDADQRGTTRVTNSTVDIGAFEYGSPIPIRMMVDTTSDSNLMDCAYLVPNDCSLRGAINLANVISGAQTITFDPSVFNTPQTITLTSALPNITTNMTIVGPGANLLTVSGANAYRPFYITNNPTVSLSDLTVTQGYTLFDGGNIRIDSGSVTLSRLIVSYGQTGILSGGGIFNSGTLTIQDSTISHNSATQAGGGISNIDGGVLIVRNTTFSNNVSGANGGGIFNYTYHVTIEGSTFNNNTAVNGGGLSTRDLTIVTNSTFSGNSATAKGGAIAAYYVVQLVNSTVSGNSAPTAGGLYMNYNMDVYNSIIADSSGGDCFSDNGTLNAQNSLIEDGSCGVTNGVNGNLTVDPLLQALADNGGPTQTMALAASSPAINAGDNSYLSEATAGIDFNADNDTGDSLDTDQREAGRVVDSTVDMGAVENPPSTLVVDTASDTNLTTCTDQANDCSLRGALNLAKAFTNIQTITFDSSVFSTAQTITLTSSLPDITTNVSIIGPGTNRLTVSGADTYRPFNITNGANVSLSYLTVTQGHKNLDVGGNMFVQGASVTLSNVIISHGQAMIGAGVYNQSGTLTIQDSVVSDNVASGHGGGIYNSGGTVIVRNTTFRNNGAGTEGGGLFDQVGTVTIQGSTFNNNTADRGGGLGASDNVLVSNSTFSGNSATTQGGGINTYVLLNMVNSTISGNSAPTGGGLYLNRNVNLYNSILANNNGGDCAGGGPGWQFNPKNSLIEDGGCGVTSGVNGNLTDDPLLQAIANNGGLTQTMLLLSNSPAINAGDNSYLSEATLSLDYNGDGDTSDTLDTDQRGSGFNRTTANTVDMGAVEFQALTITVQPQSRKILSGQVVTLSVSASSDGPLSYQWYQGNSSDTSRPINGSTNNSFTTPALSSTMSYWVRVSDTQTQVDSATATLSLVSPNYVVDTTSNSDLEDCTNLPNDCSLFGAITLANVFNTADTITFDSTVFNTPQTITLDARLPDITTSMTIRGPGANLLTISGNNLVRPFYITGLPVVTISDVTITQGYADYGGAINLNDGTLTLQSVIVSNSHATQQGGGLLNINGDDPSASGTVRIINSTFSGNTADDQGGAIASLGKIIASNSTFSGNSAGTKGGAIYSGSFGSVQLFSVTLNDNSSYEAGGLENYGTAIVVNSTFADNSATFQGGGILNRRTLTLINSTVSGNTANTRGGGIYYDRTISIYNSIIANNVSYGLVNTNDCFMPSDALVDATVYNTLIKDGNCDITNGVNGNLTSDPMLLALANYGGSTETYLPQTGSPVINAGNKAYLIEATLGLDLNGDGDMADTITTDQRGAGYTRVDGANVDMGAAEVHVVVSLANAAPSLNYTTSNFVTLTWNRVSWTTGYEVQISLTNTFATLQCGGTLQAGTNLSVTTCQLSPGTYYWRVRALPASGTNGWSQPDTFTIGKT